MIINHKKLNQTPKKIYEIVPHAMHCGGGMAKDHTYSPFFAPSPTQYFACHLTISNVLVKSSCQS